MMQVSSDIWHSREQVEARDTSGKVPCTAGAILMKNQQSSTLWFQPQISSGQGRRRLSKLFVQFPPRGRLHVGGSDVST